MQTLVQDRDGLLVENDRLALRAQQMDEELRQLRLSMAALQRERDHLLDQQTTIMQRQCDDDDDHHHNQHQRIHQEKQQRVSIMVERSFRKELERLRATNECVERECAQWAEQYHTESQAWENRFRQQHQLHEQERSDWRHQLQMMQNALNLEDAVSVTAVVVGKDAQRATIPSTVYQHHLNPQSSHVGCDDLNHDGLDRFHEPALTEQQELLQLLQSREEQILALQLESESLIRSPERRSRQGTLADELLTELRGMFFSLPAFLPHLLTHSPT